MDDQEYDEYDNEDGGNSTMIIIVVIVSFIIVLLIIAFYLYSAEDAKESEIVYSTYNKTYNVLQTKDTATLSNYRINLGSPGSWSYVVIDDALAPDIPLNGYQPTGGMLVDVKPTSASSKRVTIYANTLAKTGGYFVGDGAVPNGSVVTASFYTSVMGNSESILANVNNGVLFCTNTKGPNAETCIKHGTNLFKFLRKG